MASQQSKYKNKFLNLLTFIIPNLLKLDMFYLVPNELREHLSINKSSTCLFLPDYFKQMQVPALQEVIDAWQKLVEEQAVGLNTHAL